MGVLSKFRRGAGPEYNLIQRPELAIRLRKMIGARQAHFLPTLNEGLQAVIIADDLTKREEGVQQVRRCYGGMQAPQGDGANIFSIGLWNPGPTVQQGINRRVVRLYRVSVSVVQAIGGATNIHMAYSVFPTGSTLTFDSFGTRRFAHVNEPTEYTALNSPRANPGIRSILAPFVPIGVVHYSWINNSLPFILDLPGITLLDDAYFDMDIARNNDGAWIATDFVNVGFEWTEETLQP